MASFAHAVPSSERPLATSSGGAFVWGEARLRDRWILGCLLRDEQAEALHGARM